MVDTVLTLVAFDRAIRFCKGTPSDDSTTNSGEIMARVVEPHHALTSGEPECLVVESFYTP
jgi:hypothetical protein